MFEGILKFFKKIMNQETEEQKSKETAKERLHLVLMQDRANVSADFLELMKQEIIDVIKKYIDVDESAIDVRLTNKNGEDGENGAPALYANIPILNIRNDMKKLDPETGKPKVEKAPKQEEKQNEKKEETKKENIKEEVKEEAKDEKKEEEKVENKNENAQQEKQNEVTQKEKANENSQEAKQNEEKQEVKEEKKEETSESKN